MMGRVAPPTCECTGASLRAPAEVVAIHEVRRPLFRAIISRPLRRVERGLVVLRHENTPQTRRRGFDPHRVYTSSAAGFGPELDRHLVDRLIERRSTISKPPSGKSGASFFIW